MRRVGSLFKNEPAHQKEPAHFQLTSCNTEVVSREIATDYRVVFKMMRNSVPNYKRASFFHQEETMKTLIKKRNKL